MTKIVINAAHGGFSISLEAAKYMAERGDAQAVAELAEGGKFYGYGYSKEFDDKYQRDNPLLIEAVEKLGRAANGSVAALRIVEIPDGVDWIIEDYDGAEWVAEQHRTWS